MAKARTVLITGASSGIGRALAELYAAEPDTRLLLTGRSAERLEDAMRACRQKGARAVEFCTACVTRQDEFEAQILDWDDRYGIDIVIANAGISGGKHDFGSLEGAREGMRHDDRFRQIMKTNLDGMFNTVNPLIPRMQARGSGQIVLMSSMAGFRGLPSAPAYSVSKNAVRAYAEALRPLLARDGIRVNVICPGFIRTPLTDVNTFPMPFLMEPEEAARRMKKGIDRDKPLIAFPLPMFLLVRIIACLPRRLGDWVLGKAPEKP